MIEIRFEAVLKNSQCWSWGDVRRQTVQEAASSHRNTRSPTAAASAGLAWSHHGTSVWRAVLIPRRSIYHSGGGVERRLKLTEVRRRQSCVSTPWLCIYV